MKRIVGPSLLAQPGFQPVEPVGAQFAVPLARHQRIECDQANRQSIDRVVQEAVTRQIGMIGEDRAQGIARIVVAGNEMDRHGQRRQQLPEKCVFLDRAAIDQVAGGEHDVGPGIERVHVRHCPFEEARRVDALVEQLARRLDVHVGDLGDQHGFTLETHSRSDSAAPC